MRDDVKLLCAALDDAVPLGTAGVDPELLHLAGEMDAAFATWRLPRDDRDRILERALAMAEAASSTPRQTLLRRLQWRPGGASGLAGGPSGALLPGWSSASKQPGLEGVRQAPGRAFAGHVTISRGRWPHPGRKTSALIGGTAVVALAAIGATVVRQRRAHGSAA